MKNTKITVATALLFIVCGLCACSDWTETKYVDHRVVTPAEQDPAAYAAYAAKVRAYKQTAHKLFYVAFNNTDMPAHPGQTLAMLPDSTDIIAVRHPQIMTQMDIDGMRTAQQDFATRILCFVDNTPDAGQVIAAALEVGFDGFVVGASATPELVAALGAIAGPGKSKLLVLEGASIYLQGEQKASFDYNVLPTASAATIFEVEQQVGFAHSVYGFAYDRILLTTSMDGTITDANFVKRDMLSTMLALLTDLGPLGGLSIAGIESDYYHVGGNFLRARNVIQTLNQSN